LGSVLGVWQYKQGALGSHGLNLPEKTSVSTKDKSLISLSTNSKINKTAFRDTAEIEPLMALSAPDKNASVEEWYEFALSFDDLYLGKRFKNSGQTTPMLTWYAYIAKYKPEAIYKLYNNNKIGNRKLIHLLRMGFLESWDEHIADIDKLLASENTAILSMANSKGIEATRKRVSQAIFKLSDKDLDSRYAPKLNIENLLFAMKSMDEKQLQQVPVLLKNQAFRIDPRSLYRLKQSEFYQADAKNPALLELIQLYSEKAQYQRAAMSSYKVDGALLGGTQFVQDMIDDVENNAKQPLNFYCTACGLALATDGLIAYPLIKAAKKDKAQLEQNSENGMIISTKGLLQ